MLFPGQPLPPRCCELSRGSNTQDREENGIALKEGLHYCNGDFMSEGRGPNTFVNELCNFRDDLANMGEIINEDKFINELCNFRDDLVNMGEIINEDILGGDVLAGLFDEFTQRKDGVIRIQTLIMWTTTTALHVG